MASFVVFIHLRLALRLEMALGAMLAGCTTAFLPVRTSLYTASITDLWDFVVALSFHFVPMVTCCMKLRPRIKVAGDVTALDSTEQMIQMMLLRRL